MIDRLLFTIEGVREALLRCTLFSLITGALIIGQAFCLTTPLVNLWYNHALVDQIPFIAGFFVCLIVRQFVDNAQSSQLESFASRRADEFRTQLFKKLFNEGQSLVQEKGTGGFSTLLVEGVDQVEAYLRMILPRMTKLVIVPVMLLVLLFVLDWVSALIGLLVFPAIILQMALIGHTASLEAGKQHKEYQRLANHFLDSIRGIDTLKLFGRSKDQITKIYESSEQFRIATMKTLRVATLSGAVLDAFSTISIAAIAVMLGFRLVDGSLTLFPALFVLVIMPDYFRPIREFASDYHASLDGKNSLRSILAIVRPSVVKEESSENSASETDQAPKTSSHNEAKSASKETNSEETQRKIGEQPSFTWTEHSALHLHNLSYQYATEGTFALEHLSATFSDTQIVGIIGQSGSGKSTLAHLLAGLNDPSEGSITISTASANVGSYNDGVTSLHTLRCQSWQKQLAYIPQNPHIFHASLKENLAFYQPDAPLSEIERICSLMGLNTLIEDLPEGLDTIIGEGAHSLSGGQAQRIAFARAFLNKNCKVLIFDEPTAHLDIETELELKERMLELMQDKLVFLATHRLHWLSAMDTVLVLKNGRLIAQDTPENLMQSGLIQPVKSIL